MSSDISAVPSHPAPSGAVRPIAQAKVDAPAGKTETTPHATAPAKPDIHTDPEQMRRNLQEAIANLNEQVKKNNYNLNFSMDEVTNRVVVRVRSTLTGDVIRQIPDEAVLRFAHNTADLKGLMSDQKI